jgi:hypothetical protein
VLQSLSVDTVLPNGGASIHGLMDRWRMQACRDCTSGAFIMNRLVAYRALKGKHDRGIKAPLKIALRSRAFLDPIDWPAGRPPRQSTARQLYAHSTTRCPWPGPPSLLLANHTTLAAHLWLYVLALELRISWERRQRASHAWPTRDQCIYKDRLCSSRFSTNHYIARVKSTPTLFCLKR